MREPPAKARGFRVPHRIHLDLPNLPGSEKLAMDAAASVAQDLGLPCARVQELRSAVAEACINAMEHGNAGSPDACVGVDIRSRGHWLWVNVADSGGIFALAEETPRLEEKLQGTEPARGWGVYLMRHLVDDIRVRPRADGRKVVRLGMRLDPGDRYGAGR